ncbi:MAG: hypothetical protein IJ083_05465 [Clostridia bacterium]|nr:hypothetical protein [Clostridia bacterium]
MSLVHYTNPTTGRISVYESTSCYDPVLKQSRPKRKYLGTLDPETGELIPSSGRAGRPRKQPVLSESAAAITQAQYDALQEKLNSRNAEILKLKQEIADIKAENTEMKKAFLRISSVMAPYLVK